VAAYIYDRTCRECREHHYESLPWDQVNNELYSEAMSLNLKVKFDNLSKNIKSLPFPVDEYCYSFNDNDGRCERGQNCKYPHVCEKHGGNILRDSADSERIQQMGRWNSKAF
jgi:hypothetical protein